VRLGIKLTPLLLRLLMCARRLLVPLISVAAKLRPYWPSTPPFFEGGGHSRYERILRWALSLVILQSGMAIVFGWRERERGVLLAAVLLLHEGWESGLLRKRTEVKRPCRRLPSSAPARAHTNIFRRSAPYINWVTSLGGTHVAAQATTGGLGAGGALVFPSSISFGAGMTYCGSALYSTTG
jgi:hypothetical protein